MLGGVYGRAIDFEVEGAAERALDLALPYRLNKVVVTQAVGDEIGDGRDLEPVVPREGNKVWKPRHGAIVVHDLADHSRRIKPGEPGEINSSLGVASANEHTALLGHEREHVAGGHDVAIVLGRIDSDGDGVGAVVRRDAGRHAFARFDRHGEGRGVPHAVRARHQLYMNLLTPLRPTST